MSNMVWRPIDLAPKDKNILVTGGVHKWDNGAYCAEANVDYVLIVFWDASNQRWVSGDGDKHWEYNYYEPTHFMPLPPPPAGEQR